MIVNAKQKFKQFEKMVNESEKNINDFDDDVKKAVEMIKSQIFQLDWLFNNPYINLIFRLILTSFIIKCLLMKGFVNRIDI